MHEGSGFDGKVHNMRTSEDMRRILVTYNAKDEHGSLDPSSYAVNVPANVANLYHKIPIPGKHISTWLYAEPMDEWLTDEGAREQGLNPPARESIYENSEASGGLSIDNLKNAIINKAATDKQSLAAVLQIVASAAQVLGSETTAPVAGKERINNVEKDLLALAEYLVNES